MQFVRQFIRNQFTKPVGSSNAYFDPHRQQTKHFSLLLKMYKNNSESIKLCCHRTCTSHLPISMQSSEFGNLFNPLNSFVSRKNPNPFLNWNSRYFHRLKFLCEKNVQSIISYFQIVPFKLTDAKIPIKRIYCVLFWFYVQSFFRYSNKRLRFPMNKWVKSKRKNSTKWRMKWKGFERDSMESK